MFIFDRKIKNKISNIHIKPSTILSKSIVYALGLIFITVSPSVATEPDRTNNFEITKSDAHPEDDVNELADLSIEELMDVQVVVTASRHKQKINTVPYAISVVTADDIRASGARSIPDALRLVPGVDIADLSFSNAAISPRGFHGFISSQVLVLVDGRQIFDSLFGGTLWGAWPFQMEDIERIEVIRGPGGVTWGANAVNGVINIITKHPADQQGLTLTTGGGSRGWVKQYISYGYQEKKLSLRISAEYEGSDGFRKGGSYLGKLEDDFKGGRISIHAIYEKDHDNTFTFSAGSSVVDGGFPRTPLAGIGRRRNPGTQASFLLFNWESQIKPQEQVNFTAFVNDFHVSPGVPQIDYRYQQIGFQYSHRFKTNGHYSWMWGIDSRIDLLDTSNSDPMMLTESFVATTTLGLYIHNEWQISPRWVMDMGGRIEYESYGGIRPSGRVALSYKLSDNEMFYTSVSNAFLFHTAGGRVLNIPLLNGLVVTTSERNMDIASLVAFEMGYRGKLFDRLDSSVNLFWHDYEDLSSFSFQLGPPGLLQYKLGHRSGRVSLYGLEFESKYKVSDDLTLLGNYT